MHRWMWALGAGLLLVGCGGGSGPPSDEPPREKPPKPVWGEGNPRISNEHKPRLWAHAKGGTTLRVYASTTCTGYSYTDFRVDASGLAEFTVQVLENSTTHFTLKSLDNGLESPCSDTFSYKEDSLPPSAPRWWSNTPKVSTSRELTLTVVEGEFEARVELFASGDCTGTVLGTATVDKAGAVLGFPMTVAEESTTSFTVRATDAAGNRSACSAVHTFTHDIQPPARPVLRSRPSSPSPERNPLLLTTTEPGAQVSLYKSTGCLGGVAATGTADARGEASIVASADYGSTTTFSARVTDAAGNASSCSEGYVYVHDNTAPSAVSFRGFSPASPANHNAPVLQATTEPGARVLVFAGNSCAGDPLATPAVSDTGSFEVPLSVTDDTTTSVSAYAFDVAGNKGSCAYTSYVEDSTAPVAPSALKLAPTSPNTSDTVTVSGTSGPSQVLLFQGEGCSGEPVASSPLTSGTGSFSVSATVPENAITSLSVAARDTAGNRSACVGPLVYVEDSLPPDLAGVRVADGPGEDLRYQLVADVAEVNWSGFTDASGIAQYEHVLMTSARCDSASVERGIATQTSGRLTGLSLSASKLYFHCVRARDVAGNWSGFVASDGFRVDLMPPVVVDVLPARDSQEVNIHTPLRFTFSEPVDVSRVTSELLTLEVAGARVATTVSCEASGTSCTFTPVGPLPYRETVRATLAPAVKDLAGRVMESAVTVSFTTRGRAWQPPREVRPARPGLFPDVAVDGQGNALAVWVQGTSSGAYRPFASRSTAYAGWEPARELDTVHPGDVERPAVAVNEAGFGVAVWELHEGTRVDLYAVEYSPGTGWSEPRLLETRAEPVSTPRVGVDARGNALVVWRQSDGTAESLWAARFVRGGGWSAPLLLEAEGGEASVPSLALEGSGRALAAWLQPDVEGTVRVRASRFVPDSGWTPPEQAAASGTGSSVSAAMSANGSAFVLFRGWDPDSGSNVLLAHRFLPGGGWSATATRLGSAPLGGDDPSVAMDRWGRAMVAWSSPGSGAAAVTFQRFTPEDGWRLVPLGTGRSSQPSVTADGQGNFHAVWVQNVSGVDQVAVARYPEGATGFSFSAVLEPAHDGTSKRPRVRANGAGAAVTVWYRDNGGGFSSNLVYAATYE